MPFACDDPIGLATVSIVVAPLSDSSRDRLTPDVREDVYFTLPLPSAPSPPSSAPCEGCRPSEGRHSAAPWSCSSSSSSSGASSLASTRRPVSFLTTDENSGDDELPLPENGAPAALNVNSAIGHEHPISHAPWRTECSIVGTRETGGARPKILVS